METRKHHDMLSDLRGVSGIYILYNELGEAVYVGKSIDLGKRIETSAQSKDVHSFKFIPIENRSDMDIVEVYLICRYKPTYNKDCIRDDEPTIELDAIDHISRRYTFENVPIKRNLVEWDQYKADEIASKVALEIFESPRFDDPRTRRHALQTAAVECAHGYIDYINGLSET